MVHHGQYHGFLMVIHPLKWGMVTQLLLQVTRLQWIGEWPWQIPVSTLNPVPGSLRSFHNAFVVAKHRNVAGDHKENRSDHFVVLALLNCNVTFLVLGWSPSSGDTMWCKQLWPGWPGPWLIKMLMKRAMSVTQHESTCVCERVTRVAPLWFLWPGTRFSLWMMTGPCWNS